MTTSLPHSAGSYQRLASMRQLIPSSRALHLTADEPEPQRVGNLRPHDWPLVGLRYNHHALAVFGLRAQVPSRSFMVRVWTESLIPARTSLQYPYLPFWSNPAIVLQKTKTNPPAWLEFHLKPTMGITPSRMGQTKDIFVKRNLGLG